MIIVLPNGEEHITKTYTVEHEVKPIKEVTGFTLGYRHQLIIYGDNFSYITQTEGQYREIQDVLLAIGMQPYEVISSIEKIDFKSSEVTIKV